MQADAAACARLYARSSAAKASCARGWSALSGCSRSASPRYRLRTASDDAPGASPRLPNAQPPAAGSLEALVQQVLQPAGGCAFGSLGLAPGATSEAVRKRYLGLALRLHPDKADHPRAHEAFAALERAYSRAHAAAAAVPP